MFGAGGGTVRCYFCDVHTHLIRSVAEAFWHDVCVAVLLIACQPLQLRGSHRFGKCSFGLVTTVRKISRFNLES
jgi:hypothetical protein